MPKAGLYNLTPTKTGYTLRRASGGAKKKKRMSGARRGARLFKVSIALQGRKAGAVYMLQATSHAKALDAGISRLKKARGFRKLPKGDAIVTDTTATGANAQKFWDVGPK